MPRRKSRIWERFPSDSEHRRPPALTTFQSLAAFLLAASILTVTPGLDTAIVLKTAATSGPRPAWSAGIGIGLGCLAWGVIVAAGLGAILAASAMAYMILQWIGAAYLIWLGTRLLLWPRTAFQPQSSTLARSSRDAFLRGFLTNMLNPKVGVFYVTFLPQFIPAGQPVAAYTVMLAVIHVALGLAWFGLLIAATIPAGRLLRRPSVIRTLDRLTGSVFVLFGLKLALSRPS